ncbi:hypothetical protein E8E13_005689 [Curvularia kusanoi]|uniref:Cytochrome P450 monooxygenase ABA1 n=1 Tax=Curvularia kusanoi TaxID=90978 RepID=A0A9P4W8E3_CURKU|nr:hypothetical protein E8E13_005689 [Curvularia kusanoi]
MRVMDNRVLGALLDSVPPLYLGLLVLVAYLTLARLRQSYRLRHFKGPPTTGFSWWWHSKAVLSGQAQRYYGDVTEKYGPIARVSPEHLITSDPELWAHINGVRSPYRRAPWYYHAARFEPGKDNVFTECDNERHDARRKKMYAGYSGKENPTLEPAIDSHVQELIQLVKTYASRPSSTTPAKPMDLAEKIPFFTLDVISHIGLGSPFGNLISNSDVNSYLKSTEEGLKIGNTAWGMGLGWMRENALIGPLISPSEKDPTGYGRMMHEARKIVDARRAKPSSSKSDMLASFIRNGVAGDDLFQEAFEQILAGSDTTAAAIRIILLFVITNPRVYAKLRGEIDAAVADGVAPNPPSVIPDARVRALPYLSAVVREGLRVHPPVVNLFSRVAPDGGDTVTVQGKEYFIPAGTMIGYSAWSMHRNNTALYGPDACVFRPERWFLDESDPVAKERLKQMVKTNDMVFGYGRWVCLGRNIALIEVHKCVFEMLRHFDLALRDPAKPWRTHNSLGLWEIKDMWVDVCARE